MNVTELKSAVDRVDGFYQAFQTREKELKAEVETYKSEIELLTKTSAVLKHLLDILVKEEITKMAGLVTFGLRSVFEDQDLTFVPVLTKKNEKMHVELRTKNRNIESSFGSYGGSVAVIESLLLRILCILKKDLARFMLLDETFPAVSEEYRESTGKLITGLCKKLNLDILLVTQERDFQDCADHVYFAKESDNGLVLEKIK